MALRNNDDDGDGLRVQFSVYDLKNMTSSYIINVLDLTLFNLPITGRCLQKCKDQDPLAPWLQSRGTVSSCLRWSGEQSPKPRPFGKQPHHDLQVYAKQVGLLEVLESEGK